MATTNDSLVLPITTTITNNEFILWSFDPSSINKLSCAAPQLHRAQYITNIVVSLSKLIVCPATITCNE